MKYDSRINELIMWLAFFIIIVWLFFGCTTPREYINNTVDRIIRYDTVRVVLPADQEYKPIVLDSYGFGENSSVSVKIDTVYRVDSVWVKGKQKIVYVPVVDTVTIIKTDTLKVQDKGFFDGVTLIDLLWVFGGIAMLGFLSNLFKR